MINRTVLMTDALHFSAMQAINPYYFDSHSDSQIANAEHQAIQTALKAAGVEVITTPSTPDSQDGVYSANHALVRGDTAILARLPDVRKAEEPVAAAALEKLGKQVVMVPEGLRFSGQGDALACGNYLFCGKGYRSDEAAQQFAAETLGYERIQLQTIPQLDEQGVPVVNAVSGWEDSFFYDIDLALAIIKQPENGEKGLIAYCRDAFLPESQQKLAELTAPEGPFEAIIVSLEEAEQGFACNLVSTGSTVVMGDQAPALKADLEAHGIIVVTPHIRELAKGGGYIRCTTLTID